MSNDRYSAYRIMWVFVLFDLPTDTKRERKRASDFRNDLLNDGFFMFQFSIYLRHCSSRENAAVHMKRTKQSLPPDGKVSILQITDKQFAGMENYFGRKEKDPPKGGEQLEFF